jgi:hypothetical protein
VTSSKGACRYMAHFQHRRLPSPRGKASTTLHPAAPSGAQLQWAALSPRRAALLILEGPRTVPACLQCNEPFQPGPVRGGRVQTYCQRTCQIKAANVRRDAKRRSNLSTAVKPSGQPQPPEATNTPPSASRALSDSPNTASDRIAVLTALAHSRGGIDPWQVAELAKLKGRSAWSPLRVILAP